MSLVYASDAEGLVDQGVGLYTDLSVANQVSTFTISNMLVSCGVGTTNNFEMLMYSLSIDDYEINRTTRTPRAGGNMRSITRVLGEIVEDTTHSFIAIGKDNDPPTADHFSIHFTTDFWDQNNPLCTPSNEFSDHWTFGGDVFLGGISVEKETKK